VQLEAIKPPNGTLPSLCQSIEYLMGMYTPVVAYPQRSTVDKTDATATAQTMAFQVHGQRDQAVTAEFDHAVVTDQVREVGSHVDTYIPVVEGLELSHPGHVKEYLNGHYLR